jgi:hypothetical protein
MVIPESLGISIVRPHSTNFSKIRYTQFLPIRVIRLISDTPTRRFPLNIPIPICYAKGYIPNLLLPRRRPRKGVTEVLGIILQTNNARHFASGGETNHMERESKRMLGCGGRTHTGGSCRPQPVQISYLHNGHIWMKTYLNSNSLASEHANLLGRPLRLL